MTPIIYEAMNAIEGLTLKRETDANIADGSPVWVLWKELSDERQIPYIQCWVDDLSPIEAVCSILLKNSVKNSKDNG